MIEVQIERQLQLRNTGLYLLPLAIAAAVWLVRFLPLDDGTRPQFSGFLTALAIVAAGLTLATAVRLRHRSGKGWILVAAACIATGYAQQTDAPDNIVANLGFVLMIGSLAGAVLIHCRFDQERQERAKLALDLLPPVIALSVASWVFVVGPYVVNDRETLATKSAVFLHGLGGLALITLCAAGLLTHRWHRHRRASHLFLAAVSTLVVADALWLQRLTIWPSVTTHLPGAAFGLALTLFGAAGVLAFTRKGIDEKTLNGIDAIRPASLSSQVQNAALGGLLVLAGGQSLFGEPVPYGIAVAVGGALSMLVFFVARESVVMRRERHLHQEIGQLSEKIDGLISQVGRDPLTGLLNHRAVHERLDHELANGRSTGQAVAVVLVDVDNFKTVNDTLGHQAGDRVLHAVASIMTAACRGSDVAARYAGDEFMLVLPGLNEMHAAAVGGRIAEEVRRVDKDLNLGRDISVSLSIGVAVTHRCQRSMAQTVAIADAAMYDAKEAGKNRVVVVNADTLVITEPFKMEQTVDEIMAASLTTASWQAPERRHAG